MRAIFSYSEGWQSAFFTIGEYGPHIPDLQQKWTTPPKPYTEATLLRAMETAGKLVDNDELRDALKENGIGRPSTRAAIIETLFKRHYIRKGKKNLFATPTGTELISLIHEELLKSAELTGIWERKLRQIESKNYSAQTFILELKAMVADIIQSVLADNSNRRVSAAAEEKKPTIKKRTTTTNKKPKVQKNDNKADYVIPTEKAPTPVIPSSTEDSIIGRKCPICGKGIIIKGKTAYGCSNWKEGCNYRIPFDTKV